MVEELPVVHGDKRRVFPQGQLTAGTAAVQYGSTTLAAGSRDECCKHCSRGTD